METGATRATPVLRACRADSFPDGVIIAKGGDDRQEWPRVCQEMRSKLVNECYPLAMIERPDLRQCLAFINCQLKPAINPVLDSKAPPRWRAVTLSRQAGSGGHLVAEKLAEYLQTPGGGAGSAWMVFDRNLVERVLEDHHLPAHLARFMPEDRVSEVEDTLEELLGVHPPFLTLVHKTAETILRLAELGNVILLGRGANVITSRLDYVLHVRLVGSLAKRAELIRMSRQISEAAAREFFQREDRGRKRYLKKYFRKDIEDPLLYHLIINTDLVAHDEAARLIGDAVVKRGETPRRPFKAI